VIERAVPGSDAGKVAIEENIAPLKQRTGLIVIGEADLVPTKECLSKLSGSQAALGSEHGL
jgi:hypothetical protein